VSRIGRGDFTMFVNLLFIAFVLYQLFSPEGILHGRIAGFMDDRKTERLVSAMWADLSDGTEGEVLVEFIDYLCPACQASEPVIRSALSESGAQVVLRHLPSNPQAAAGARASLCAEIEGKRDVLHERLFTTADWTSPSFDWSVVAYELGIEAESLISCMRSTQVSERLQRDGELAREIGVRATPTFAGLGGVLVGFPGSEKALLEIIVRH